MFAAAETEVGTARKQGVGMDVEREIHDLKRRVGDLEGAMNVLNGNVGQLHPGLTTLTSSSAMLFFSK